MYSFNYAVIVGSDGARDKNLTADLDDNVARNTFSLVG